MSPLKAVAHDTSTSTWRGPGSAEILTLLIQIPNEVTDYYLQRVGFECEDVRL